MQTAHMQLWFPQYPQLLFISGAARPKVSVRPRPSHCENVYSLPPCSQPLSFACLPRDCAASSCGGTNLSPKTALMARVRVGIGVGTAPAPASAAALAPNATADQAAAASVAPPSNPAVRADAFAVPALRRGASGVVCSASPASATSGASSSGSGGFRRGPQVMERGLRGGRITWERQVLIAPAEDSKLQCNLCSRL